MVVACTLAAAASNCGSGAINIRYTVIVDSLLLQLLVFLSNFGVGCCSSSATAKDSSGK